MSLTKFKPPARRVSKLTTPRPNLAELVRRLGDIPIERIILDPPPGQATLDDALELSEAADKQLCELIDGTLVEKAMGFNESRLAVGLMFHLQTYLRKNNIGFLSGADGMFRMGKNGRMPDIAFVSWRHFPNKEADLKKYPIMPFAPDLAVEVVSQSNTAREIEQKQFDYFNAGVKLMWVIDPNTETATVHRLNGTSEVLTKADVLSGEDVLPGLSIPVAEAL